MSGKKAQDPKPSEAQTIGGRGGDAAASSGAAGSPGVAPHAETPANTPQTTFVPPAGATKAPGGGFAFNFNTNVTSRFAESLAAGAPTGGAAAAAEPVEEIDVRGGAGRGGRGGRGGAGGAGGAGGRGGIDVEAMMRAYPELAEQLQAQLGGLVGMPSGFAFPPAIKRRLRAVQKLQNERVTIETAFHRELSVLKAKYEALTAAVEDKVRDIVSGAVEPTDADLADTIDGDEGDEECSDDGTPIVGVPKYWLGVMQNCADVEPHITEKDEELLVHLTDVRVATLQGEQAGFRIDFFFAPNDFISDAVISKTYHISRDEFGEENFEAAIGTEIAWKAGKDLTVEIVEVVRRGKKTRTEKDAESFFNFFYPRATPAPDAVEAMNPDEIQELQMELGGDFELGDVFRSRLVPRALGWFTGLNTQLTMDKMGEEGFGEDMYGDGEEEDGDYVDGAQPAAPPCKQQ